MYVYFVGKYLRCVVRPVYQQGLSEAVKGQELQIRRDANNIEIPPLPLRIATTFHSTTYTNAFDGNQEKIKTK